MLVTLAKKQITKIDKSKSHCRRWCCVCVYLRMHTWLRLLRLRIHKHCVGDMCRPQHNCYYTTKTYFLQHHGMTTGSLDVIINAAFSSTSRVTERLRETVSNELPLKNNFLLFLRRPRQKVWDTNPLQENFSRDRSGRHLCPSPAKDLTSTPTPSLRKFYQDWQTNDRPVLNLWRHLLAGEATASPAPATHLVDVTDNYQVTDCAKQNKIFVLI